MTTIFGTDISSFQHGLDLSRLAAAAFVIAKTTEGTYYTDADYDGWRRQAAALGKTFAWYHFLSGEDVHAQVAHCLAHVGDKALPGMLDVEPTGNYTPTLAQALAWIDAAHAAGLNLRLAYIPRWLHQQWDSPSLSGLVSRDVYLVSSSYPGGSGTPAALYPGGGAAGWLPYGGVTPLIYQFTSQASDGGMDLDYNAFRGTLAELQQILGGGDMPLTQADADLLVNAMLAKLPAATAAATYDYGRESVTVMVNGKPQVVKNVPFGQLAHGAWVATNDPTGGLEQMRGQVNDLFHRPRFQPVDLDALAASVATLVKTEIERAIAADLPADQIATQLAEAVVNTLTVTLGTKTQALAQTSAPAPVKS